MVVPVPSVTVTLSAMSYSAFVSMSSSPIGSPAVDGPPSPCFARLRLTHHQ
jgi:hypothetical protein